jgi:hypothetical protein
MLDFVYLVLKKKGENEGKPQYVRFQILTATSMKMTVFLDVAPCSLVEIDRRFRGFRVTHRSDDGGSKNL